MQNFNGAVESSTFLLLIEYSVFLTLVPLIGNGTDVAKTNRPLGFENVDVESYGKKLMF